MENYKLHVPACNYYRIAGNFPGVKFSRIGDLYHFAGLIFADARDRAHYALYNGAYFAGLIFVVGGFSAKTANFNTLENFPLYGTTVDRGIFA